MIPGVAGQVDDDAVMRRARAGDAAAWPLWRGSTRLSQGRTPALFQKRAISAQCVSAGVGSRYSSPLELQSEAPWIAWACA
jgi:hypothetical protein